MMMADIAEGIVGPVDLHALAKLHLELTRAGVANTMSNPMVDDPRILHVRYTDFIADQVATVRRYYAFAGRELTPKPNPPCATTWPTIAATGTASSATPPGC